MRYVIFNKEDKKYFRQDGNIKWVDNIISATQFKTEAGVKDVYEHHPQCKGSKNLEIQEVPNSETIGNKQDKIIAVTEEEANTAFNNFTTAINLLNDGMSHVTSLITHYSQELSKYDLMEQDILHKIEFDAISGLMAVQLCKKLKEIRINRRECKDKIEFFKNIRDGGGQALIKNMTNYNANLENRTYSVRFLTEIFGGKEVVKNK